MDRKIKDWYVSEFPHDDLGYEIRKGATFQGVVDVMRRRGDLYGYIGVDDSVIRERIFDKIAGIMGIPYDAIYDLWIGYMDAIDDMMGV